MRLSVFFLILGLEERREEICEKKIITPKLSPLEFFILFVYLFKVSDFLTLETFEIIFCNFKENIYISLKLIRISKPIKQLSNLR